MESEAPRFEYDVFLSFRGVDTRQGLASVLYKDMVRAGIRVFIDDGELKAGDKIETILEAIDNSELCVPIFSKNFASSKWCLKEVQRMVCQEKVICPVFYEVSVEDVKLKTPTYVELMEKLETSKEEIEEWKGALKDAVHSEGQIVGKKSFSDFCEEFISDVIKQLRPRDQFVVNDFIRVDNQLNRFTELLDVKSEGVRYISICGMGGIGKTTLAKFIFDKFSASFDCRSFIENIRERSSAPNGLCDLEKEHRANLDRTFKREFASSRGFNQRFYRKKVLIVLDDVDKSEQIEKLAGKSSSLGPGSRIVVTTRDVSVLDKCRNLKADKVFTFEMEALESHHALQLFSSCAFTKNFLPPDFLSLSKEVVSTAGGLPLTLEVLGSILRKQDDKEVWKDVIERSKRIPIDKVKDRLKISYDELAKDQKEIFLDIACFTVCTDKSKVSNMWEASKFFPTYGLEVLQSMSLIKMKDNNEIWMHDLLRELGRDIVRGESVLPRERSRLWDDEALEVLKITKGKENVQAIALDKSSKVTLTREQLDPLENLRFLQLGEAEFVGDFDNVLPNLRWLSWIPRSGFEARNFSLPKLVSFNLSDSSITENWRGWSLLQGAKNLKDLYLTGCFELTSTPEFPRHVILERLVLQDCDRLAAFDCIGRFGKLRWLTLSGTAIAELPDAIGSLENLKELRVNHCKLRKLTPRLSGLGKLEVLDAGFNQLLEELPEDIGRLVSLKILDLAWSGICELPPSISQLSSLERLNLEHCYRLEELPELPTSLIELSFISPSLRKVSDLSSMVNLVDLCIIVESDEEVETSNLNFIEKLIKLERVDLALQVQKSAPFPADFSGLTQLKDLSLSCQNLKDPLQLPSSLSYLLLDNVNSEEVLRIEDLHTLKNFRLGSCSCNLMDGLHLPQNLTSLVLSDCESLTKLPDLGGLEDLAHLELSSNKKLTEIPGLGKCKFLRILSIWNCGSLKRLENLSELQNLQVLWIGDCEAFDGNIDGIDRNKLNKYYVGPSEGVLRGGSELEGGSYEVEDEWQNQTDEVEDEQPIKKREKKEEDEDDWLQLRLWPSEVLLRGGSELEGGSYEDEDEWQNQTDKDEDEQLIKKKRKKDEGEDEWLQLRL